METVVKQRDIKREIYEWGKTSLFTNSVKRNLAKDCIELYNMNKNENINPNVNFKSDQKFKCYGCGREIKYSHYIYVYSCTRCGELFQKYRYLSRNLNDNVLLVIGGRTKLGHQIVIKLLDAGAKVIVTTRFPEKATESFKKYREYDIWKDNLYIYKEKFDLDVCNLEEIFINLHNWIDLKFNKLDGLIFNAAQTIRAKEKNIFENIQETNRYGDHKFVPNDLENSWGLTIAKISQKELEEVHRINSIAPFLTVKYLLPLIQKSDIIPYIIHVHAREGIFDTVKAPIHIHTNMAKASLHMFTKCLKDCKYKTQSGKLISVNGVNPGWFSVDEYYKNNCPWVVPPLDEIDGAARILYPLFKELSCGKTRNHFTKLTY